MKTKTQNKSTVRGFWRLIAVIAACWLLSPHMGAQVTVGGSTSPQDFSLLEIVTAYTDGVKADGGSSNGGLRLPRLTTAQRDAVQASFGSETTGKAKGLTIYNISNDCVETWNGAKWISICADASPICVPITDVTIGGTTTYTTGSTINLTANVAPAGATSASYQWNKDGTPIPGATGATYNKASCTSADAGSYTVTVSNSCTSPAITSTATSVTVTDACAGKAISTSGGNLTQSINLGSAITGVTFTTGTGGANITVTGLPTGVTASGNGTNAVLVSGTPTVANAYSITATTDAGCTDGSKTLALTVTDACAGKAISTSGGSLTQSINLGSAITGVTFTTGTGGANITITGLPTGVTASGNGTNTVLVSGTPTVANAYSITVTTDAGCTDGSKTLALTVTDPCAGKAISTSGGSLTQSINLGSAITGVTFTTGTGGANITITGLPTGVTASGNGTNTVLVSGTPTVANAYSITVTTDAGCTDGSKTLALTVSSVPAFSPVYNVNPGTTTLNVDGAFIQGTTDNKDRGTTVNHSSMSAGVFRYTGGSGQNFSTITTTANGVTVTVSSATGKLANGAGELAINVSGKPTIAGKAFDIPVTVLGRQLYVRVHVGCGAYISSTRTVPSTNGDPAWLQFQCFNLGVTNKSLNPLTPSTSLYGSYYQWGRSTAGWISDSGVSSNTAWGNGTMDVNPPRGTDDPCPTGWKVPSVQQLINLWNGNLEGGLFDEISSNNKVTWLSGAGGALIGKNLFLPATGFFDKNENIIDFQGEEARYHSSNITTVIWASPYILRFYNHPSDGASAWAEQGQKPSALYIRCVAN
ncbi:hypothetical protein D0T84_18760 [Dysgonomonas sp. 521]|uniref:hypothetical protein n=1 Tax=Dysgonomonas sp. 521 TaxID=2302932 RepID=UPI0013D0576C|nr:hypothetical protein [Dysgonomonas sp. 521]NDV96932.1 hypothetical protein [Dysgonomonas sp. 521]